MGIEMHSTALTQVIAKKVFMKSAKVPEALQKTKNIPRDNDSVNISPSAAKISISSQNLTEFEKKRAIDLERVKNQIDGNSYVLDRQVIDQIAEKIANMFF